MTPKALQNCIILDRDVVTHALFVLPPGEKLPTGVIVSAGPDCKELKVGDRVYFEVGQEFTHMGKEYVLMREPHVLGVFNG
jgi:co-chaperonin GroES (HSP10)